MAKTSTGNSVKKRSVKAKDVVSGNGQKQSSTNDAEVMRAQTAIRELVGKTGDSALVLSISHKLSQFMDATDHIENPTFDTVYAVVMHYAQEIAELCKSKQ